MPIEVSLRARKSFDEFDQFGAVLFKFNRLGAAEILIHLRTRRHAVRPRHRNVKRQPFQNASMKHVARCADCFVSGAGFERIAEMTNHLVGRHFPPTTRAIGRDLKQTIPKLFSVELVVKGFHLFEGRDRLSSFSENARHATADTASHFIRKRSGSLREIFRGDRLSRVFAQEYDFVVQLHIRHIRHINQRQVH